MVCLSDSQLPNTVWLAYPLSLILMTFFTFMLMQYISPTRYIHSPIIIYSHICLNLQTTACSAFLTAFTNVPVTLTYNLFENSQQNCIVRQHWTIQKAGSILFVGLVPSSFTTVCYFPTIFQVFVSDLNLFVWFRYLFKTPIDLTQLIRTRAFQSLPRNRKTCTCTLITLRSLSTKPPLIPLAYTPVNWSSA